MACSQDGAAHEVVQPVHRPQDGHDPQVQFADKGNLSRVCLLLGSGVVKLRVVGLEGLLDFVEGCSSHSILTILLLTGHDGYGCVIVAFNDTHKQVNRLRGGTTTPE